MNEARYYQQDFSLNSYNNGFNTLNRSYEDYSRHHSDGTLSSGILSNGELIDRSWELRVKIRTIQDPINEILVRVQGSMTIGKLMHEISRLSNSPLDWSKYNLWWPERNQWLLHTRTTLDQYGVQSDAQLEFRSSAYHLNVILPSLVTKRITVDYSARVFQVVKDICKQFDIRHSEELSLCFPTKREDLKFNTPLPIIRYGTKKGHHIETKRANILNSPNLNTSMGNLTDSPYNQSTLVLGTSTPLMKHHSENSLMTSRFELAELPAEISAKQAFTSELIMRPRNLVHKARINSGWLDSCRSLLEHGIDPLNDQTPIPSLFLRFKYYSFYDLDIKYDAVRINQLFEQAKWSILAGNIDCTDDEAFVFAAYQLQAKIKPQMHSNITEVNNNGFDTISLNRQESMFSYPSPRPLLNSYSGSPMPYNGFNRYSPPIPNYIDDPLMNLNAEIDHMLSELEQRCESADNIQKPNVGITRRVNNVIVDNEALYTTPELSDKLIVCRDKMFLIKRRYREMFVKIKELRLDLYRKKNEPPVCSYSLKDCHATPDIDVSKNVYAIKLSLLTDSSFSQGYNRNASIYGSSSRLNSKAIHTREEILFKCTDKNQYAHWISAFRLGSKGRTLASKADYDKEVNVILEMINLQSSGTHLPIEPNEIESYLGDLTNYLPEKIINRAKSTHSLVQRISEVYVKIKDLDMTQAKIQYIQAWKGLPDFGRTYFLVQFDRNNCHGFTGNLKDLFSKYPDGVVISVCSSKIEIVSNPDGRVQRTWNFCDMVSWTVKWDSGTVLLDFGEKRVEIKPLSANCKTLIEFIGGYVFLSLRDPSKSQQIDERAFHKLTGVSD